jgi:hypothetical protein
LPGQRRMETTTTTGPPRRSEGSRRRRPGARRHPGRRAEVVGNHRRAFTCTRCLLILKVRTCNNSAKRTPMRPEPRAGVNPSVRAQTRPSVARKQVAIAPCSVGNDPLNSSAM